eukprot:gene5379-6527_t
MEIAACPLDCFKRHVYAMHYVYNFVKRKEHEDLPDLEDKVDVFAGLLLECHPELYPASKLQEGEAPHFQSVINRTFAEEEQPTQEERTPAAVSDGLGGDSNTERWMNQSHNNRMEVPGMPVPHKMVGHVQTKRCSGETLESAGSPGVVDTSASGAASDRLKRRRINHEVDALSPHG